MTDFAQVDNEILINELLDRIEDDEELRYELMDCLDVVDTRVEVRESEPMRVDDEK